MSPSLADILDVGRGPVARVNGVVTGVVTNNQDPDGLARVKVSFPWLSGNDESAWARLAVPMAGPEAGTYFLPDVDDEVLVAFEHGDVRFPYVLGSLWFGGSKGAMPPEDNSDGKNARRTIRSPSGLTVTLDDSSGAEQIVIADKKGKTRIVVDAAKETITVEGTEVAVKAGTGKLTLEGANVEISASGDIKVKAANLNLEGSAAVAVKGSIVRIN